MAESIKLEMRKMPKDIVLVVSVVETPEYKLRLWLGKWLIWLGVWVWGCSVEFRGPDNE